MPDIEEPELETSSEPERTVRESLDIADKATTAGDRAPRQLGDDIADRLTADTVSKVPVAEPGARAPVSFSKPAMAAFDKLNAGQRLSREEGRVLTDALDKREREINAGFAKLADYKGLEPMVELARQNQTTLPEVVQRYRAVEEFLDRDPMGAITWLAKNYDVDLAQPARSADPVPQMPQPRPEVMQPQPQPQQPAMSQEEIQAVRQLYQHTVSLEARNAELEKAVRAKAAAAKAKAAGASISGGPSATPRHSSGDVDLRTLIERNFHDLAGRI
mgnify:CR=1 FL=1